jgi:hypothetical protein
MRGIRGQGQRPRRRLEFWQVKLLPHVRTPFRCDLDLGPNWQRINGEGRRRGGPWAEWSSDLARQFRWSKSRAHIRDHVHGRSQQGGGLTRAEAVRACGRGRPALWQYSAIDARACSCWPVTWRAKPALSAAGRCRRRRSLHVHASGARRVAAKKRRRPRTRSGLPGRSLSREPRRTRNFRLPGTADSMLRPGSATDAHRHRHKYRSYRFPKRRHSRRAERLKGVMNVRRV